METWILEELLQQILRNQATLMSAVWACSYTGAPGHQQEAISNMMLGMQKQTDEVLKKVNLKL